MTPFQQMRDWKPDPEITALMERIWYEVKCRAYLDRMRLRPTIRERLTDRLAFLLMNIAAWLDKPVWRRKHLEWRIVRYRAGDKRMMGMYCYDGWRPARYL